MINAKTFLIKRRKTVKELTDLVIKRMYINDEIKNRQKELKSLDNFIMYVNEKDIK